MKGDYEMINFGESKTGNYLIEITDGDKEIFEILAYKKGITLKELMMEMVNYYTDQNSLLLDESIKEYQELKKAI
jgi:hypothetical protein